MNRYFFLTAMIACSLAAGCSIDSSTSSPRGPSDFAISRIVSVKSNGEVTQNGGSLPIDCSESLLVYLAPEVTAEHLLGDFLLAAPGGCGSTVSCGWVELTVTDDRADLATDAPIDSPTTPLRVDLKPGSRNGLLTFHAELRDSLGAPVQTDSNTVLSAELTAQLSSLSACTN